MWLFVKKNYNKIGLLRFYGSAAETGINQEKQRQNLFRVVYVETGKIWSEV